MDDRFFGSASGIDPQDASRFGVSCNDGRLVVANIPSRMSLMPSTLVSRCCGILLLATGAAFVALVIFAYLRDAFRRISEDPQQAKKLRRIRDALGWRRQKKVESA